ncbi:cysteine desulfurase NifS [Desulfoluna limicola]|uniref:Cysteine desulfurase n=1 Tax=Desulfoluna limicola TaxID=2810562 RepID=A0ABN6FB00_9BACT|nr:cysteine desulfurase NifS [Desulfoluna limicola]BCS99070.1 cysteine desulfurase NifS [Desulfoluna limicola]
MRTIYLDNNATTRVADEVLEEMIPALRDVYGNPSSMHHKGAEAGAPLALARERVASLLGAQPEEILFTSCGTESDSTAINAALVANPDKKHIITTMVEHPAVKNYCENLEKKGYRVTYVPVDRQGRLDLNALYASLSEDTAIVSVMWANNESGVIFPVEEIAKKVKAAGAVFHTDAVQAVGKIDINLADSAIDMLSLSGHKLHAPKGVGALYIRKGTRFAPFLMGGHQEKGRRAGTENHSSIIALGRACTLAAEKMEEENTRVKALRDRLEKGLLETIPNSFVNGDQAERLPNTCSISFEYVEGEAILLMMNEFGICASSGSACTSGSLEPSHVLRAMGVPFTAAHGTIRFSLSIDNTDEDIDTVLSCLPGIIHTLRQMSPFWAEAMAANAK